MSHQPLVSVVIATYNMDQYLPLAVQSVLAQTYTNLEVHVVDDGSTDNTSKVMKTFRQEARVKYHYQQHQGQPQAKNAGIGAAEGAFIGFCDADDLWLPTKLAVQLPCFAISDKIGVVYSNHSAIDETGQVVLSRKADSCHACGGNITAPLFIRNFISFGTALVRRECFDSVGLFDDSLPMGIDWDLWLRISTKYEFHYLDDVTYLYRRWSGQLSHDHFGRYQNAIKIMDKFLAEHPGLLPRAVVREAWADTYVGRGNGSILNGENRLSALRDYLTALSYKPTYLPAWKSLIRLMLDKR